MIYNKNGKSENEKKKKNGFYQKQKWKYGDFETENLQPYKGKYFDFHRVTMATHLPTMTFNGVIFYRF